MVALPTTIMLYPPIILPHLNIIFALTYYWCFCCPEIGKHHIPNIRMSILFFKQFCLHFWYQLNNEVLETINKLIH